jgi:hypothetical protein
LMAMASARGVSGSIVNMLAFSTIRSADGGIIFSRLSLG